MSLKTPNVSHIVWQFIKRLRQFLLKLSHSQQISMVNAYICVSSCNKCYIKCKTELANCLCCLYGFPEWADIKCFLKMLFLSNLLQLSDNHALAFLQSADDCNNARAHFCLAFVDSTELPSPLVIGQRVWCTTQWSSEKMMWAFWTVNQLFTWWELRQRVSQVVEENEISSVHWQSVGARIQWWN